MIWDQDTARRLVTSIQKRIEHESNLQLQAWDAGDVTDEAFTFCQKTAEGVVETIGMQDPQTKTFLMSWSSVGLFAGFISGWLAGQSFGNLDAKHNASLFAQQSTKQAFGQLTQEPVSPLVVGLPLELIKLLQDCHEASLYSGWISGYSFWYRGNKPAKEM